MAFFFFLVRRAFSLSDLRHGTKNEENEKNTDLLFFFFLAWDQFSDPGLWN